MLNIDKAIQRDERRKAKARDRYASDPQYREKILAYQRAWGKANRDKTRTYTQRARAKKKSIEANNKNRAG